MRTKLLLASALALLSGCEAQSIKLPVSEKLTPVKVHKIADNINHKYADLPQDLRGQILNTVVKSLDNMIFVEGGEFEMGDFGWPYDDDPADMCTWPCGVDRENMGNITSDGEDDFTHIVRLSSYHLSKYQAELGDFDLFFLSRGKPTFNPELRKREDLQFLFQPNLPAFTQDWQEGKDYCAWLAELSGYPVDLPTEAQWEFAARNRGKYVAFPTDSGSLDYGRNFPHPNEADTFRVDKYLPTPLGFFNLSGNATDWVNDWFGDNYYQISPLENPKGPSEGTLRIRRGAGVWDDPVLSASTVNRWPHQPKLSHYSSTAGFRCSIQSDHPL